MKEDKKASKGEGTKSLQ